MIETKSDALNWQLPICGAVAAIILVLPQMLFVNDALAVFGTIPLAVVIGVILIAIALSKVRRHRLAVFGMICVFLALAWSLFRSADSLRTNARWLAHSQIYKQQVLKQQTPRDGLLKHMEWDGWGFPGAGDTVVYLVLDPSDQLAESARNHSRGKFVGIPCAAVKVHRLEHSWYTVLFYTDTDWEHCF
jgi:hypothetical protein